VVVEENFLSTWNKEYKIGFSEDINISIVTYSFLIF
jgi:hypothetical protein